MRAIDIKMGALFTTKNLKLSIRILGPNNKEVSSEGYIYSIDLDCPQCYQCIDKNEEVGESNG